jgi:hypothetical protein
MQASIPREYVVNELKKRGYRFRKETEHVQVFSHPGTSVRVLVRRKQRLDLEEAKSLLRQAGCDHDEIRAFVSASQC